MKKSKRGTRACTRVPCWIRASCQQTARSYLKSKVIEEEKIKNTCSTHPCEYFRNDEIYHGRSEGAKPSLRHSSLRVSADRNPLRRKAGYRSDAMSFIASLRIRTSQRRVSSLRCHCFAAVSIAVIETAANIVDAVASTIWQR